MPDVILTGLPRSGSTLICNLLTRCADTVALHEPIPMADLARKFSGGALVEEVARFYADTRRSLLETRRVLTRQVNGAVPDNIFGEERGSDNLRRNLASFGEISLEGKELTPDFLLGIKHNAGFVALLEHLVGRFPVYAIVRHPLAVLSSWNSVKLPVQRGRIPAGEQIDPGLRAALDRINDRTERQCYILEWFFDRLARRLPRASILRYEDVIASRGKALAVFSPGAAALDEPLLSRNNNAAYDTARMEELGRMLQGRDGTFWDFYPRESVEEMLRLSAPAA